MGLGVGLAAPAMFGFAVAGSLAALIATRALMGLGAGCSSRRRRRAVTAAVPGREAEVLGRLGSAEIGGFVAGPPVAALLAAAFGLRAPFVLLGVLLLAVSPTLAKPPREPQGGPRHPAPPLPAAPAHTGACGSRPPSALGLRHRRCVRHPLVALSG